jgi:molybdate transport system substrate-binding protein
MTRVKTLALSAVAVLAMITGCSSGGTTSTASSSPPSGAAAGGKLTVFAAASLKAAFTEIGEQFKTDNPGSSVEFSFAGSSDLVTQLTLGARADVSASAETRNMDNAAQTGLLDGKPVNFASNTPTIVVAPGTSMHITTFHDLTNPEVLVVVCAPPVACGGPTQKVEKATGVTLAPVNEETSVTDVLNKVTIGQADAGLVYVTDAQSAGGKVTEVPFDAASRAVNTYPIAALTQSRNAALVHKFVDLATGEAGQKALVKEGFAKP